MSVSDRSTICDHRGRLEAFWDGELSSEERQRTEAHLPECAGCRQRLQELKRLAGALEAYRPPASGWSSDAEFWQSLAPQLRPRTTPAREGRAAEPSAFLAPVSLLLSSIALRGLAALALAAYALYQWQLLPASLSAAMAAAMRLAVGPLAWATGRLFYTHLATALKPVLAHPSQACYLILEAATIALLSVIAGLYIGWLLRWLRDQSAMQATSSTE
jgi:anti-sigma factor RsiW